MRVILISMSVISFVLLSVTSASSAYADQDLSKLLQFDDCKASNWKSERSSSRVVGVQGVINQARKRVYIEVWKHDRLIGTASVGSNPRGVFLARVHTSEKAPKYPRVIVTCQ